MLRTTWQKEFSRFWRNKFNSKRKNHKIMKLKFLSFLTFIFIASAVVAADAIPPVSVAVFDFTTPYKVRLRNDIGVVTSLLTANFSSNPQFTLVDRAELNKILKEQAFGLSGDISPETAAKIGRTGFTVMVECGTHR